MKTIWKFPLDLTDLQELDIPFGYKFLSAQMQNGKLCLWAEVNPAAMKRKATIAIVGTGNPFPLGQFDFISTVQMGPLVWHIYEKK